MNKKRFTIFFFCIGVILLLISTSTAVSLTINKSIVNNIKINDLNKINKEKNKPIKNVEKLRYKLINKLKNYNVTSSFKGRLLFILLGFITGTITWPVVLLLSIPLSIGVGTWCGFCSFINSGCRPSVYLKSFLFYSGLIMLGAVFWPFVLSALSCINC